MLGNVVGRCWNDAKKIKMQDEMNETDRVIFY